MPSIMQTTQRYINSENWTHRGVCVLGHQGAPKFHFSRDPIILITGRPVPTALPLPNSSSSTSSSLAPTPPALHLFFMEGVSGARSPKGEDVSPRPKCRNPQSFLKKTKKPKERKTIVYVILWPLSEYMTSGVKKEKEKIIYMYTYGL